MIGKMIKRSILSVFVLALFAARASAGAITVDQVLYQSDIANANLLSGTVDMTFASNTNTLSIILTNTSSDLAGDGAGILLTGLGFQLPTGVSIASGTAVIAPGSTGVNFAGVAGTDVSKEWGYDNSPLNSGVFQSGLFGGLTYNTVVGSMVSITTNQFAAGSIDGAPAGLAGPDFGLVSNSETGSLGGGNEAIRNSIIITLVLSGTSLNLLDSINKGNVGLSFGSPNPVPEPPLLSLLLVPGLAGLYLARKRAASVQ
jgi:hypothetical protein